MVIFRMESSESRISTVVIRGSTDNYMDDIERAIDDGVNTFKCIARDGRYVLVLANVSNHSNHSN